MKKAAARQTLPKRAAAMGLALCTLWGVAVTAGSETLLSAVSALRTQVSAPLSALRWELGDLGVDDGLSPAAIMAIGESPQIGRAHV